MSDTLPPPVDPKTILLSIRTEKNLSTVKRLLGDKWQNAMAEWRETIETAMGIAKTDNPLSAAARLGKLMSDHGDNPMVMLAVATQMSIDGMSGKEKA